MRLALIRNLCVSWNKILISGLYSPRLRELYSPGPKNRGNSLEEEEKAFLVGCRHIGVQRLLYQTWQSRFANL